MIPCLHDKLIFQRELIDNLAAPRGRLLFDLRLLLTVFGFTCFVSITKPGLEVCTTKCNHSVISYEEYIYVSEVICRLFKVYKLFFILFAR